MSTNVRTDIQALLAAGVYDARPPAGQEWDMYDFGGSLWLGAPPLGVPEINVGIFDGVLGPSWLLMSTDIRGWYREKKIAISNGNYIRIVNANAGLANNISFVAQLARSYGANPTATVVTDLQNVLAGANYDLQPPAGFEYVLEDVGSTRWIGGAPFNNPDVTVSIFDGVAAAPVCMGANDRGWNKNLLLYLNNTNYVRLTNTNGLAAVIAMVGRLSRAFGSGTSVVRTDVQAVLAGANWDVRPPLGEEWLVTEIGSSVWVGVAPAQFPNVTVSLFDGANASIIARGTDNKLWMNHDIRIVIDNTNYLRINDASGGGQNIAVSAVMTRRYQ